MSPTHVDEVDALWIWRGLHHVSAGTRHVPVQLDDTFVNTPRSCIGRMRPLDKSQVPPVDMPRYLKTIQLLSTTNKSSWCGGKKQREMYSFFILFTLTTSCSHCCRLWTWMLNQYGSLQGQDVHPNTQAVDGMGTRGEGGWFFMATLKSTSSPGLLSLFLVCHGVFLFFVLES